MEVKILEGKHRQENWVPCLNLFNESCERWIRFTKESKYELKGIDPYPINKLFGISQGYHKWNSARWGWNFNPDHDAFALFAYCYVGGRPVRSLLKLIKEEEDAKIRIDVRRHHYEFSIDDRTKAMIHRKRVPNIGYGLSGYFGGEPTAPKDISYWLE